MTADTHAWPRPTYIILNARLQDLDLDFVNVCFFFSKGSFLLVYDCRLRSDRVRIHEQLALAIIAVQILFLIGVGRTAADHTTPEVRVWKSPSIT